MRWYIVDGIDGSGKTTTASSMKRYFEERGDKVLVQVHPSERRFGQMAKKFLQSSGRAMYALSSIFFILDVLVSLSKIRRWKERYDRIIFVRYVLAAAYLPERFARFGYRFLTKLLPLPKNKLLIDIEPSRALTRISARDDGREMFENLVSLEMARKKMLDLAMSGWEVLDNNGSEEAVDRRLLTILSDWDLER